MENDNTLVESLNRYIGGDLLSRRYFTHFARFSISYPTLRRILSLASLSYRLTLMDRAAHLTDNSLRFD